MADMGRISRLSWIHGFLFVLLQLTFRSTDALSLHEAASSSPTSSTSEKILSLRKRLTASEIDWVKVPTEAFFLVDDKYAVNHDASYYNYTGYNSYQPFRSELYRLQEKFPDFVEVEVIGKTHEGRELLALHINKNHSQDVVFLGSLVHAREWVTGCVVMEIINKLLNYQPNNTKEADEINLLLNSYHFILMPVFNPDGYEYTFTTNRLWRKNREPTSGVKNCKGTDVNRNFVYAYSPYDEEVDNVTERGPCSDSYPGKDKLSTKEARAINSLMMRHKHNMRYYSDYHMFGNDFVYSYGDTKVPPKNKGQLHRYGSNAIKVLQKLTNQTWKTGEVANVIYKCKGIMVDHVHYYITPISFTVEIGPELTDFRAPDSQIGLYTNSQWAALVSNLLLLREDIDSNKYQIERTTSWRLTNML